jgi:phosphate uptake regulator
MSFNLFGRGGSDRLEGIEEKVQTMLRHDRHEFDLAMSALLGDRPALELNEELRSTDQLVNRLEREIRREVMVHASVFGGIDTPAVLVYMSIVKDIERVGDYAKNLLDLARDGANLSQAPDGEEWRKLWAELAEYIEVSGRAFRARDAARCRELIAGGDRMLTLFDSRVSGLVRGGDQEGQAVARALAYRYLKRVVAHLMNLLSAVVMPMDQLDYFAEDPEDRKSR